MPSRSSAAPMSSVRKPSTTNESTPAFSGAVPMIRRPGIVEQAFGHALEEFVLVPRDVLDAELLQIIERGAQSDGVRDVAGAGLESRGRMLKAAIFSKVTSVIMLPPPCQGGESSSTSGLPYTTPMPVGPNTLWPEKT